MPGAPELVDESITTIEHLLKMLGKSDARQVRNQQERSLAKATALTWFKQARGKLVMWQLDHDLAEVDVGFKALLESSNRVVLRAVYVARLRALKRELVTLRTRALTAAEKPKSGIEAAPDFTPLVRDPKMQAILFRRWHETGLCMGSGADLAATVMMGGLLEGLLLARLNLMPNQAPAFKAAAAPRDRKGKTLQLRDWALKDYIAVGHELGWIGNSARDVGVVLRDYRNYIHPAKELSHGITLTPRDTQMLWSVFVTVSKQVLASAATP